MRGAVSVVLLAFFVSPEDAQQKKPNLLVIWGDDIGQSNISACNEIVHHLVLARG